MKTGRHGQMITGAVDQGEAQSDALSWRIRPQLQAPGSNRAAARAGYGGLTPTHVTYELDGNVSNVFLPALSKSASIVVHGYRAS